MGCPDIIWSLYQPIIDDDNDNGDNADDKADDDYDDDFNDHDDTEGEVDDKNL